MILTPTSTHTVLYDAACPFCQSLAELAAKRASGALAFEPWQTFQTSTEARHLLSAAELARPADKLRVLAGATLLEGERAWQHLLDHHPDLESLAWLAERLGLATRVARVAARSGDLLRRLCRRCGR